MDTYFTCPACGGHYFGRDAARNEAGLVIALETVRCRDQHKTGCKWRGEWTERSRVMNAEK